MQSTLRNFIRAAGILLALAAGQALGAITVTVELNPNPVRAGEVAVAQITVANDGGGAVNTVTLQAPVPADINDFSPNALTGGGTCTVVVNNGLCDSGEVMTWNFGTLPAGTAVTVSAPLTVAGATAAGTVLTQTATAFVNAVNTASDNASTTVTTTDGLNLAVDEDKDRVVTGEQLTYTLTYSKRGIATNITGTTLTFPVPAGTTFVSATGGGVFAAGNVTWNLGTLPFTQSATQQVVVTVNNGLAAGTVIDVNGATITGTGIGPESATATAVTRVAVAPPLAVAVEMNGSPLRPSEQGVAEITVSNRSGAPLTGVTLLARVPQALASFTANYINGDGSCVIVTNNGICDSGELISWTLGTLPAGAGVTLTVPIFVAGGAAAGRVITLETLASDDSSNRSVLQTSIAIDSDGPLTLAVDEDFSPVATGSAMIYTLTYGNRAASSSITGTTLTFPVPANTTFVSATGGGTLSGGVVTWNLGSVPATQSGQQQVVVTVNNGLVAGTLLQANRATIGGLNSSLVAENARATAVARVATAPPLALGIELNQNPIRPGEQGIAQFTVTNRGDLPLTGVVLQARVPESIVSFSANYITGGGTCIVAVNNGLCDSAEGINWNLGTIPAGGGITVSVPVFVENAALGGRLLTFEALVNDDGANRAVNQTTIAADTDQPLSLTVDDDKNPVAAGNLQTYTLTYGNRGASSNITGTTLNFPVPAGTSFVSATGGGVLSGGVVTWTLGSLGATQSGTQQVVVAVNGGATAGTLLPVNFASIAGLNSSLVAESARARNLSRVAASPALVVGVEINPDPMRPGQQGVAQLTVSNRGGVPLTGVVLQARVPEGVFDYSAGYVTNAGTCIVVVNNSLCDSGEILQWTLGTIPAGTGVTVSTPVFVDTGAVGGRLLLVEALANDDGFNRAVNESTFAVDSNNPLTLAVNETTDAVVGDGIVQYVLTYGNRSASSTTGTTLSFPLPVEAVLLQSSGGTITGNSLVWNLGSLAAGAGGRRTVTLQVPAAVTAGSIIPVHAVELKGNVVAGVVPDAQRATAMMRVEATKALGLTLSVNPDPVLATQTLTSTITVTNNTAGTLTGIVLQARVPVSVNDFSPAAMTGGGTCIIVINNSLCDSAELANWAIGTLASGASTVVTMPPVVTAGTANGNLIPVETLVSDDGGRQSTLTRTVLVNPFADGDGDTVPTVYDNCTTLSNTSQCDSDSDGFGNRCDGDLNNNTFTNAQDTTLFRQQLGGASVAPVFNEADLNCNGFVNAQDTTLFRGLLGNPPGPSAQAP